MASESTHSNLQYTPAPFLPDLSVTCLDYPDRDNIFDYVCRCADDYEGHPLEVTVAHCDDTHEVRLQVHGGTGQTVIERDADVFFAVRNAFRRLETPPQ